MVGTGSSEVRLSSVLGSWPERMIDRAEERCEEFKEEGVRLVFGVSPEIVEGRGWFAEKTTTREGVGDLIVARC
ncbi:hypothetical protein HAX54_034290 [Datura stramonium]|uniref:Uncharacterized protein n=1 Tax=Datura stramonium TaxID=4076 RepID=A0ABS8VEH9_DATST|nr:hypothetical protein [Datura stramonium]